MLNKKGKQYGNSGVPLGGIGAGKIELCPNGKISYVTTNNNWDMPICGNTAAGKADDNPAGIPGAFFGLYAEGAGAKLFKTHGYQHFRLSACDEIEYEGKYPVAKMGFKPFGDISTKLEAFSPLILNDSSAGYKDSSIPAAVFTFKVKNIGTKKKEAAIFFSWQNLIGVGGYVGNPINSPEAGRVKFVKGKNPSLVFSNSNKKLDPRVQGNYTLMLKGVKGAKVTYRAGWDWTPFIDQEKTWRELNKNGELPNLTGDKLNGIISAKFSLKPGEEKWITYVLSWYFPHFTSKGEKDGAGHSMAMIARPFMKYGKKTDHGKAYANWFKSSKNAAEYVAANLERLYSATKEWHNFIYNAKMPSWFSEKIINCIFPLYSNSIYAKNYDFTVSESPTDMSGCLGTIDQRAASNSIYTMAFPDLTKSELELFAGQQIGKDFKFRKGSHWSSTTGKFDMKVDREGAIRHDVGWDDLMGGGIGHHEWATLHWPDLTSVFVLQCYEYYLWTGDEKFIAKMYPHIKSALAFQERLDQDGDGVADLWGPGCCTYDNITFPYYGLSSFIASLYMAALKTAGKIAEKKGDYAYADECEKKFKKTQEAYEKKLWNEEKGYYVSWSDSSYKNWKKGKRPHEETCFNCTIPQAAGQWFSNMFNMGQLSDKTRLQKALKSIYKNNVKGSLCPTNETAPNGDRSASWPYYAETYFAALAIQEGLIKEGLEVAWKMYEVFFKLDASPWSAPLVWKGPYNENREWGRWYMTNPATWFIMQALSGFYLNVPEKELGFFGNGAELAKNGFTKVPVVMPAFNGYVTYKKNNVLFEVTKVCGKVSFEKVLLAVKDVKAVTVKLNGKNIKFAGHYVNGETGKLVVKVNVRFAKAGDRLEIAFKQ